MGRLLDGGLTGAEPVTVDHRVSTHGTGLGTKLSAPAGTTVVLQSALQKAGFHTRTIGEEFRRFSVPRAPRLSIRVPVRHRLVGETVWQVGVTENISETGLLFRTAEWAPVSTPLEVMLGIPGKEPLVGRVVRLEWDPMATMLPAVAIRFEPMKAA